MSLTAERLREVIHYNPEDGTFVWLVSLSSSHKAGSIAGCVNPKGYVVIRIDRHLYRAHRLAWFYMTGEWPDRGIDHEDTNRSNNRWLNLRVATDMQNSANSRRHKDNSSGFKGVHLHKQTMKWAARIMVAGKSIHLGLFPTPEAAHAAYAAKAIELSGEFARVA